MFSNMFDELIEVTDLKNLNNLKCLKKIKVFGESSKSRGVFKTLANIYGGAFLWMHLTTYCFHNESSIIDVRQGYI